MFHTCVVTKNMASVETIKGNKVKLQTFMKWGISNVCEHKKITEDGFAYVNYIWCKVCASINKYLCVELSIGKSNHQISAEHFITGTSNVMNDAVSNAL